MSYYISITLSNLLCCMLLLFFKTDLSPFMLIYPFIPFLIIISYLIIKKKIKKNHY